MTHEAWDVPARTAYRELEGWSHRWRGLDGGDGARLAGMLARLLVRVTPREKLPSLRYCLDALITDHMADLGKADGLADEIWLEALAGEFVERLQGPQPRRQAPAPAPAPAPARVVVAPWRCRWFGHAWRQGQGRVAMFCERADCEEVRRWPDAPPRILPAQGVFVGVAAESVREGALVTVTLDGEIVPAKDGPT